MTESKKYDNNIPLFILFKCNSIVEETTHIDWKAKSKFTKQSIGFEYIENYTNFGVSFFLK